MRARSAISTLDTANGAIILVFGLFLFSIQDIIIKHFSDHYSVLQIVFVRGLIALGLLLLMIKYTHENISLISRRPGLMVARGLLGFSSYTTYYLAVAAMPLAEVVSITFTMPLFVTAMSALILREKVGMRRWSAVVVGFVGVLIILSPSGEFNPLAVLFAFAAAITYASQTILTRFLGSHDHPMTIAFNAILVFTVASGILSLLLLGGVISVSSNHPSLAFFGRDWSMPTDIIVWAVVFGYLFWNEVPGVTTIFGIFVLISSSLYIWYRERQIERSETALLPVQAAELPQQEQY
jgi:drug/metabolite transporter (DMT)-like permease